MQLMNGSCCLKHHNIISPLLSSLSTVQNLRAQFRLISFDAEIIMGKATSAGDKLVEF